MDATPGDRVELRDVLLLADGDKVTVGAPLVADAVVVAEVVEHGKGPKVVNFKFKAKVRYRRKRGHRQGYTKLAVREIRLGGASSEPEATAAAPRRRARAQAATEPETADIVQPEEVASSGEAAAVEATPPAPRRRRRAADAEQT